MADKIATFDLLGAVNQPMEHFLELFVYTCFIDRAAVPTKT